MTNKNKFALYIGFPLIFLILCFEIYFVLNKEKDGQSLNYDTFQNREDFLPPPITSNNISDYVLDNGILTYSGVISPSLLATLSDLKHDINTLILTSVGGNSDVAKEVGSVLKDRSISLIIADYCFSACAHYIFLPSNNPVVKENALIGFHHTDFSLGIRFARTGLLPKAIYDEEIKPKTRADIEFFRQNGINIRWAYLADFFTNPICVEKKVSRSPSGNWVLFYVNEYDFWIPTQTVLLQVNPSIKFASSFDFDASLEHASTMLPTLKYMNLKQGDTLVHELEDPDFWQKLPFCSAEFLIKEKTRRLRFTTFSSK